MDNVVTTSANPVTKPIGAETPTDALGDAKRMSTSETDGNQSNEHKCPTCGRVDFETERGMHVHHSMAHGESLNVTTYECEICGTEKTIPQAWSDNHEGQRFCSVECKSESQRQETETRLCAAPACKNEFTTHVGDDQKYCSLSCSYGNRDIVRTQPVELSCEQCGCRFETRADYADDRRFCSRRCMGQWQAEHWIGEDSPAWRGGSPDYYGESWYRQRRAALERDGHECVVCGDGDLLDVHHIRPFREFGVENHEEANALDNLVCLCRQHHSKWEGIPLRPEVKE